MRTEASGVPDTGEAETHFQGTDLPAEFRYKSGISEKLIFERINEVTLKLTNGEQTNVPACHGHWAGYRTGKAVAWVIEVFPGQWLARCSDRACGPSRLKNAKANALAMAKGGAGEYQMSKPVAHLNGLTARLLEREAAQIVSLQSHLPLSPLQSEHQRKLECTHVEAGNATRHSSDAGFDRDVASAREILTKTRTTGG